MLLILISVIFITGCATAGQAIILPGEQEELSTTAPEHIEEQAAPAPESNSKQFQAEEQNSTEEQAPANNEQDLANQAAASEFLTSGQAHYLRGEYDPAQEDISHAINIYPFSAPAHLLMGKILLLRGAARRDAAQLESARLMFKMAVELDPEAEEARQLLDLLTKQD